MTTADRHPGESGWVAVNAPARLHLGFLDFNGSLGRRFGSLGMALQRPATRLAMRRAARPSANGPDAARALRYACTLITQLGLPDSVEINVERAIPTHAGLGSGTQLALAIGAGIAQLFEPGLVPSEAAFRLGRGSRSGIGVGAFEQGGFLVDGGCGPDQRLPPLLARLAVPDQWRLLLIFDDDCQGVHGEAEQQAFERLPPFTEAEAGALCRLLLMQVLPALAESNVEVFGGAISEIQSRVGSYFAPLQGGQRYTSERVAKALQWMQDAGAAGGGQSSWGPTGFVVCRGQTEAEELLEAARENFSAEAGLRFLLSRPRNAPARVDAGMAAAAT